MDSDAEEDLTTLPFPAQFSSLESIVLLYRCMLACIAEAADVCKTCFSNLAAVQLQVRSRR